MLRRINTILEPLKSLNLLQQIELRTISTTINACTTEEPQSSGTLSKAMKAYLQRAQEHDEFIKTQKHEFEIGKRHLANMMGENPETFTQQDVDNAIEYLFPSGLYEKKARPLMKPPEQVFPQRKAAEFDETGRPHHFLFYTGRPNFYQILHDVVQKIDDLNRFEDSMVRKNLLPDSNLKLDLGGSQWVDKTTLEMQVVELMGDREYNDFVNAMDRLAQHNYAYRVTDFIMAYRKPLMSHTNTFSAIDPQIDAEGRQFVTVYECRRKRATATVTLRSPGTGLIKINQQDINYFPDVQQKEQVIFPLIFANMEGKIDVEAEVHGGGPSGQAGAIRWGISWGMRSFVDLDTMEQMRLAGLLSPDIRTRERKKPGQQGARRKFTWKKR